MTAISSQRNKNVVTLDAAGTSSRVVTNSGRMHEAVRLESPWPVYPIRKTMAQIPTHGGDDDEEGAEAIEG